MAEGDLLGGSVGGNKTWLYVGLGVAVVAVLVFRSRGGSAPSITTIGGYSAEMAGTDQARYGAASSAFGNLAGVIGGVENSMVVGKTETDVAGIQSKRDIALAGVQAQVENAKTAATIETAQIASGSAAQQAHIAAKSSLGNNIVSTVGSIAKGVLHFFGL
jgi:hypothetical protein